MSPRPPASQAPQSDETDATDGDLADQLLRLTRRLHHAYRQNFAPVGVTPAQARLLRTLSHESGEGAKGAKDTKSAKGVTGEPPRMADLAERLGVVPRQVTTLVDALEERGFVRRRPDAANRRVTRIELTDGGRSALQELHTARKSAAEEVLAPLTPAQREGLSRLLTRLDTEPGPAPGS